MLRWLSQQGYKIFSCLPTVSSDMVGNKRLRLCNTCGTKHTKPTGKKCHRVKRIISSRKMGTDKEQIESSSDSSWETDMGTAAEASPRWGNSSSGTGISENHSARLGTVVIRWQRWCLRRNLCHCHRNKNFPWILLLCPARGPADPIVHVLALHSAAT